MSNTKTTEQIEAAKLRAALEATLGCSLNEAAGKIDAAISAVSSKSISKKTKAKTPAQKLRKEIDALIKSRRLLAKLNASQFAIDGISQAIDNLEDRYIALVNESNA